MNGLALATRGYVSSAVATLVTTTVPEVVGANLTPSTVATSTSPPKTLRRTVRELRPFTQPKRKK